MLVIEFGPREAARKLGLNENTVLGWAHRYEWNSPKLRQNKGAIKRAQSIKMQSTPAEALIAHHKQCEEGTKTALMDAAYKAACEIANKGPLDISNPMQFQAFCSAVSRLYGWRGESQVNVAVNNQVGIVVTEAKRAELQAKLRELQDADTSEEQSSAPVTLSPPQTELLTNVGADNSPFGAHATAQTSIFIMPGGEGVSVPLTLAR